MAGKGRPGPAPSKTPGKWAKYKQQQRARAALAKAGHDPAVLERKGGGPAASSTNGSARADAPPAPPRFSGPLNTAPDVLDALRAAVRGDATLDTQAARWLLDYLTKPGVAPDADPGERLLIELASTCPHCGGKL